MRSAYGTENASGKEPSAREYQHLAVDAYGNDRAAPFDGSGTQALGEDLWLLLLNGRGSGAQGERAAAPEGYCEHRCAGGGNRGGPRGVFAEEQDERWNPDPAFCCALQEFQEARSEARS